MEMVKSTIGIMYLLLPIQIGMDPLPIRFPIRILIYLRISILYKALLSSTLYLQTVSFGKGLLMEFEPNIIRLSILLRSIHVQNQIRIYTCILSPLETLLMSGLGPFPWVTIFQGKVFRSLV